MSMAQGNDELLEIFTEEARDLLDALFSTIQAWSLDLNNKNIFADLKRDLHTLKGGARMVSQPELSALAHELESLCEALVSGSILPDKEAYNLVAAGYDQMMNMLEAIKKKEKVAPSDILISQFKQKIANKPVAIESITKSEAKIPSIIAPESKPIDKSIPSLEVPKSEATKTTSTEQPKEAQPAAQPQLPTQMQPTAQSQPQVPAGTAAQAPGEIIRVSASLLEKLNTLSIENNIIRVNIGHYIDNFNSNLGEANRLLKALQEKLHLAPKEANLRVTSEMMALFNISKNLSLIHANLESLLLQQGRIALELQDRLVDTRMVPFNSVVPRLSRITRQVANEINKKVDFNVLASEGEIDRNLLEHLVPSLEHLLRNAIDHGIETPHVRLKNGKQETGSINLRFFRMGNEAGIEISDDGAGIDANAVRKKAMSLGLLKPEDTVTDEEAIRYILEPGFSTKDEVSEISGRGVGMDVVNTVVKGLGGNLSIDSKPNEGSKFTIRLPFTTSMNRALLVVIQGQTYGILLSNVESILLIHVKQIREYLNKKAPVLSYEKKDYQLKYLGSALGLQERPIFSNLKESLPVLLFDFPDYKAALLVDNLAGSQEVVVQTLGPQFKLMDIFSGATLLADGRVIIILDVFTITARSAKLLEAATGEPTTKKKISTVLVVDDSVTIRTVTKNFLERHKYIVVTAKDGIDALEKLKSQRPDIILLDVEMPRMDGFVFAEKIKKIPEYSNIPIIMITFCAGEEQRNLSVKLGVNRFMSKPYQEPELLDTIESLLDKEHE